MTASDASLGALGTRRAALEGARRGAALGLCWGALELVVGALLPRWLGDAPPVPRELLAMHALFAALYACGGAGGGAALGALLARWRRVADRRAGEVLGLATAGAAAWLFALHVWTVPLRHLPFSALAATAVLLGAALSAGVASAAVAPRVTLLAHPAAVPAALLTGIWLGLDRAAAEGWAARALLASLPSFALLASAAQLAGRSAVPRRPLLQASSLLTLALVGGASSLAPGLRWSEPPGAAAQPGAGSNVVLVVLDTVRADRLSAYGHDRATSPRLEALAREATLYEQAYAPGDMTLSSHASLFTGLYPRTHGAHFDEEGHGLPLERRFDTLAELLARAGWRTAGVAANHVFFGRGFGLEQGFGWFDAGEPAEYALGAALQARSPALPARRLHRLAQARAGRQRDYRSAEEINARAFALLGALARDERPFLLFVNYMDAHWPLLPPPEYARRFEGWDEPFPEGRRMELVREVVRERARGLSDAERRYLEAHYDAALAYLDDQLAALVARLDALGLSDDTLLVVTSDHGEALGEHGLVGHALSTFQDQVHVPLLVRLPGQREGRREATPVSLVDLLPTVCALAGIDVPPDVQGRSLLDLAQVGPRDLAAESFPNPDLLGERFRGVERALLRGPLKLIAGRGGGTQLYDLERDPRELRDLAPRDPRAAALEQGLEAWLATTPPADARAAVPDPQTLERMRQLGYGGG